MDVSSIHTSTIVHTSGGATGGYPRLEGDVVNVVPVRSVGAGPRVQRGEEGHVETVGVGHCLENKSERLGWYYVSILLLLCQLVSNQSQASIQCCVW